MYDIREELTDIGFEPHERRVRFKILFGHPTSCEVINQNKIHSHPELDPQPSLSPTRRKCDPVRSFSQTTVGLRIS